MIKRARSREGSACARSSAERTTRRIAHRVARQITQTSATAPKKET